MGLVSVAYSPFRLNARLRDPVITTSSSMQIWPAIDLRGGRCVRLEQGDFSRETVFGDDPAAMARHWVEQGATRLHLVDLDGARSGEPLNAAAVTAILAAVTIPCQLGGGVRSETTIRRWIEAGVERVVIGTEALKRPAWFGEACRQFPQQLVLGIDARDGQVATDGWTETSHTSAVDLAAQFAELPLAGIVYTDIATDGMLAGPNVEATAAMCRAARVSVIASGGVTSAEDVQRLAGVGAAGCIIGRALYEKRLTLSEAIEAAQNSETPG